MSAEKPVAELWPIERVIPYEKNAKKHPPDQIDELARSIEKFGWTQPIVVDANGVIIIGHGRRLAAIRLGRTKVPVVCRKDLSVEEAMALRLADNKVTSTDYDLGLISEELNALANMGIDLDIPGFSGPEIDRMTADFGEIDDDVLVEDIGAAVDKQRAENERRAAEIDEGVAPIADAFGFKRCSIAQSRELRSYMSRIETELGTSGPDALLAFFRKHLAA